MTKPTIEQLMAEAGMTPLDDLVSLENTLPMDYWSAHAAVHNYSSFEEWLIMSYREKLRVKAYHDLGVWNSKPGDKEHYEGLCRGYSEVFANWKMMKKRMLKNHD
jgi:hypothetical protein